MTACTIVVPCYNEAHRLDLDAFARALAQFPGLRLVFVDDGSSDRTQEVLASLSATRSDRARLLALERNRGKGEAVRQGMLSAFTESPEWAGYWDADLATPFDALRDFFEVARDPRIEIIIGSRVKILGRDIQRKAHRHYFGRVFATGASLALGFPIYDTQCGAKLFRVTPRTRALFAEPFVSRWVFDVELLARYDAAARREGQDPVHSGLLFELALRRWHHIPGSKVGAWDSVRAALDLWRIYRRRVR